MVDLTKSHNLDKLNDEARGLLEYFFQRVPTGWTLTYMVEVRLDDPIRNMGEGGEGLHAHGGNGSKCYQHHYGDPDWAVVHVNNEDWRELDHEKLLEIGEGIIYKQMMAEDNL